LGEVRFESICEEQFATCNIRSGMYGGPSSRTATSADRERLKLPVGNGTVVSLNLNPETTVPRFDQLAVDLERHIELRYSPPGVPHVPITFREIKRNGREHQVVGFQPDGTLLLEQDIHLPEYARYGGPARLRIYKTEEDLLFVGARNAITRLWRSEAGVLIVDGRTAHDLTFFHARGCEDAAASHIYGELLLPQVPQLLREYEEFEALRERDAEVPVNVLNPMQVTDPDRFGLNLEHPFVRSVADQIRPILERILQDLQRDLSPSAQGRVSAKLRDALDKLGEELAERFGAPGSGTDEGKEFPMGLRFIPSGLRIELGKSRRIGLYYRPVAAEAGGGLFVNISSSSEAVRLNADKIALNPVPEHSGLFRGAVEITGVLLSDLVTLQAEINGETAVARLTVREPTTGVIELERDLQFSQRRYTSVPGRRKRVDVYGDRALADLDVELKCRGIGVALSASSVRLQFDNELGVAVGTLYAEAAVQVHGTLEARQGVLSDEAAIVFQDFKTKPRLEFGFDDKENFGPGRRFKWDLQKPNVLHIAAKHPTLSRVLGPDMDASGIQWPGQHDPQARAILAELISEAYVDRRLDQERGSLGMGPENLVDPTEYEFKRYSFYDECFMICHTLLTPPFGQSGA
jgi:hypothetical protein